MIESVEDRSSTSTTYVGKREPYHLGFVLYVNQTYGGRWADRDSTTMCPQWGNTAFRRTPRKLVTTDCGILNLLLSRIIPVSRRNWVLKLYSRRGISQEMTDGSRSRWLP
jgi:hypothetical protein